MFSAEVLRDAYNLSHPKKIIYMTDGGSENIGVVDAHLLDLDFDVTHWVAGKSIRASNSMIERVFHTLKNEFGLVHCARDGEHLEKILYHTIEAYMDRPHSELDIYSPREVIMGKKGWFDKRKALDESAKLRYIQNKESMCKACSCSSPDLCKGITLE